MSQSVTMEIAEANLDATLDLAEELARERAKVERLRALVARAEKSACVPHGYCDGIGGCPWCTEGETEERAGHKPNCPAFSAPGVVR